MTWAMCTNWRCEIVAPFGRPVVPLVKRMMAGSSSAMATSGRAGSPSRAGPSSGSSSVSSIEDQAVGHADLAHALEAAGVADEHLGLGELDAVGELVRGPPAVEARHHGAAHDRRPPRDRVGRHVGGGEGHHVALADAVAGEHLGDAGGRGHHVGEAQLDAAVGEHQVGRIRRCGRRRPGAGPAGSGTGVLNTVTVAPSTSSSASSKGLPSASRLSMPGGGVQRWVRSDNGVSPCAKSGGNPRASAPAPGTAQPTGSSTVTRVPAPGCRLDAGPAAVGLGDGRHDRQARAPSRRGRGARTASAR